MNNIKALRLSRGLSQRELSLAMGVSQTTVSEWESGEKNPSSKRAAKLADYFGVSIDAVYRSPESAQSIPDGNPSDKPVPHEIMNLVSAWNTLNLKGKQIVQDVLDMARKNFPIDISPVSPEELAAIKSVMDLSKPDERQREGKDGLLETGRQ